eukprot:TRINITY_DN3650_c0_g1_i2.p1 TRINITY_DN3650_c0_g1~~TRINITY_DN3650_c0_g1_i2.p1  ORF type:complete len:302 (+),score=50.20 TRINITY_DN3650_c0_g1_i2:47-952(+)
MLPVSTDPMRLLMVFQQQHLVELQQEQLLEVEIEERTALLKEEKSTRRRIKDSFDQQQAIWYHLDRIGGSETLARWTIMKREHEWWCTILLENEEAIKRASVSEHQARECNWLELMSGTLRQATTGEAENRYLVRQRGVKLAFEAQDKAEVRALLLEQDQGRSAISQELTVAIDDLLEHHYFVVREAGQRNALEGMEASSRLVLHEQWHLLNKSVREICDALSKFYEDERHQRNDITGAEILDRTELELWHTKVFEALGRSLLFWEEKQECSSKIFALYTNRPALLLKNTARLLTLKRRGG